MDFQRGDRVRLVGYKGSNDYLKDGMLGTFIHHAPRGFPQEGVDWDDYVDGHDLHGNLESKGHGWYVERYNLELVSMEDEDLEAGTDADLNTLLF